MSKRVLPYRTPPADVVAASGWFLVTADGDVPLPAALPDWDYRMNLRVRRDIHVDVDRARAAAGLPTDAALAVSAVWTATGSGLSGPARHVRLSGTGTVPVTLDVRLEGTDLGGLLLLDTIFVLAERRVGNARPASPRRAGSVLWSDRAAVRLQGDAPQFPMAVIDFALTSFPENAGWHLQISGGMESATMGALLLLVNERNTVTATAFENAARPRPLDRVVLSAVYADTARTLVEHALRHDDFDEKSDYPDDSLGATLLNLFDQLFPDQPIADLRLRNLQSPALFASDLQAAVKIFEVS
ncbi:hypothetical protein [Streptomyces sp. NPDC008125]|uniref:hypothetical protein n=1 Tax=Streptomyces sp. NPDC008125 TaxID=3364811 RepID=UPI0036E2B04B